MIEQNEEIVEESTNPVEEITEENTEQPNEEVVETTTDESKFDSAGDDSVVKIDLDNPPQLKKEVKEEKTNIVKEPEVTEETTKEPVNETTEEQPVIEEVIEEVEQIENAIEEAVIESENTGEALPENVQKLVDFMNETGGDINDYVNLNRDISKLDDSDALDEYYKTTKSHLTPEERNFLLEDNFGYDEEMDDPKEIRKKKIALKEQVAEAKAYLDRQKSKYYEEIKAGSKLTEDQQKAIDFFNKSEEQKKLSEVNKKTFLNKTNNLFDDKFKGFEYNVGDKRYRFNVKDVNEIKTAQSDINNFVSKFTDEENKVIEDAAGYHKSLFTAMNADAIANHFYEQGKADAIKDTVAKDKNINMDPRQTHGEVNVGGVKYKVLGDSVNDFKFRIKKKN